MEKRLTFTGTGKELFVKFLVGCLLTGFTLGIYAPWFMVSLWKYMAAHTRMTGAQKGDIQFRFDGSGWELLVLLLVGYLLTLLTLGFYLPWFMVKMVQYVCLNGSARAEDGTVYRLRFLGSGKDLLIKLVVGYVLSLITLGLYMPWFVCSLQKYFHQRTEILSGATRVGTMDFVGTGGALILTWFVGLLLTIMTLGIYIFWFQVKLFKFFAQNTRYTVEGEVHAGDFTGTGKQLFVKLVVGYLLTLFTFGIYGAWFMTSLFKWQIENTRFKPVQQHQKQIPATA